MAKRGRPRKTKKAQKVEPVVNEVLVSDPPVVDPPVVELGIIQDRIMRYRRSSPCPQCQAHPVVCTMRRSNYAAFRCRRCGYRWEVG